MMRLHSLYACLQLYRPNPSYAVPLSHSQAG